MNTTASPSASPSVSERGELCPLVVFTAVTLAVGWVLLSIPLLVDVPLCVVTLGLGLAAAVHLSARKAAR